MVEREFYDRKNELEMLRNKHAQLDSGEMLVLYGRRRVGKTELVKQFLKNVPKSFYFYVELAERKSLLDSLSRSVKEQLNDNVVFSDFYEFLSYIDKKVADESLVLVIDEFQRFLNVAPEFMTHLQNYWDSKLKNRKILILLLGSSIGMIHKVMNSQAGALYGRASKIKISPFRYSDFRLMFKELSEEEKVITYSVFGGTPYYLEKVKKVNGDIHNKIFELILKNGASLLEEPKNLLEYENVRVHAKYNSILQASSFGKETLKEIDDFTKIGIQAMPAYINRLDELLDLLGRKDPVLGKERLGRYCIKDNFFRFWYKFIFPNQTTISLGNTKLVAGYIKENLNGYIGRVFEDIIKELLVIYNTKAIKGLNVNFENIGSWWDRNGNEIDILAYNLKEKNFLIGEVKWTNKPLDLEVVEDVYRKSKFINYSGEHKILFASKSGFTPRALKKIEEINGTHLDLKEIEELFNMIH